MKLSNWRGWISQARKDSSERVGRSAAADVIARAGNPGCPRYGAVGPRSVGTRDCVILQIT